MIEKKNTFDRSLNSLKENLARALACFSPACPWLAPRGRQPELAGAASWNTGGSCLNAGDGFSEAL